MSIYRSVTQRPLEALRTSDRFMGLLLGAMGVLTFSFSFPATKLALESFNPWFVASGRAVVAALLAAAVLWRQKAVRPPRHQWLSLAIVAGGVVIGFPTLSSLALQSTSASHSAVVIAILPATTTVLGALRARESPSPLFWVAATAGAVLVTAYTVAHAHGTLHLSDLYLLAAVLACAMGYAEGGLLARSLGAPQTICWALILALPLTLPAAILFAPGHAPSLTGLIGFAYVSLGSMFLGFFWWYGGLARGGVARVSQLQLAQTPLTLVWSAVILGESIDPTTSIVAAAALLTVVTTQRARVRTRPRPGPSRTTS